MDGSAGLLRDDGRRAKPPAPRRGDRGREPSPAIHTAGPGLVPPCRISLVAVRGPAPRRPLAGGREKTQAEGGNLQRRGCGESLHRGGEERVFELRAGGWIGWGKRCPNRTSRLP